MIADAVLGLFFGGLLCFAGHSLGGLDGMLGAVGLLGFLSVLAGAIVDRVEERLRKP